MLSWNVFTVKQQQGTLTPQLHYAAANSNPTSANVIMQNKHCHQTSCNKENGTFWPGN